MEKLIKLTSRTYYTFKINTFVFAFHNYVAMFTEYANQIQGLGGMGGLSLSFWICYFCNVFDNAVSFLKT